MIRYSDYNRLDEKYVPPVAQCAEDCDQQPFVGWDYTREGDKKIDFLFSQKNLDYLSNTITEALDGVDPEGRDIIVPKERICEVLNSMYTNSTRPNIGSIHSKDVIPAIGTRNDILEINNQTISVIVSYIRNEIEMTENNKKLTVWTQLYGDFNKHGLRAHPPIKIKKRRPQPMMFNMFY